MGGESRGCGRRREGVRWEGAGGGCRGEGGRDEGDKRGKDGGGGRQAVAGTRGGDALLGAMHWPQGHVPQGWPRLPGLLARPTASWPASSGEQSTCRRQALQTSRRSFLLLLLLPLLLMMMIQGGGEGRGGPGVREVGGMQGWAASRARGGGQAGAGAGGRHAGANVCIPGLRAHPCHAPASAAAASSRIRCSTSPGTSSMFE